MSHLYLGDFQIRTVSFFSNTWDICFTNARASKKLSRDGPSLLVGKLHFFLLHSASSEHTAVWTHRGTVLGQRVRWEELTQQRCPEGSPLPSAQITPPLLQCDKCDTFLGRPFLTTSWTCNSFSHFLLLFHRSPSDCHQCTYFFCGHVKNVSSIRAESLGLIMFVIGLQCRV